MFDKKIVAAGATALFARVATADVAPGFPIHGGANLTVVYGNDAVSPPGELLARPVTAQRPTMSSPVWWADEQGPGKCVLVMVDLDVPRNNSRVQLVHWVATNITRPTPLSANATASVLDVPDQNPVPYVQPSPPVGDLPHAYTLILMPQPRNFSLPAQYANLADNRVGFNVSQFVIDSGLDRGSGGGGLAANWITVQNLTGAPTNTSFPPPRPSQTGSSDDDDGSYGGPSRGDASSMDGGPKGVWAGVTTAVFAAVFAFML